MRVMYPDYNGKIRTFDTEAPILLVDFDGTCTDGNHFDNFSLSVPEAPYCREVLKRLEASLCTITLWTCRTGAPLQEAIEWLNYHGIPFHFVNQEVPWCQYPNETRGPKVFATYYIDDRNIGGFPGWLEVERLVYEHPYFKAA